MLVIFYKLSKNPEESNIFFFFFLGGGGGGCSGGVNILYKCLKWHFYSSRNTNVPNYSEIHALIQ